MGTDSREEVGFTKEENSWAGGQTTKYAEHSALDCSHTQLPELCPSSASRGQLGVIVMNNDDFTYPNHSQVEFGCTSDGPWIGNYAVKLMLPRIRNCLRTGLSPLVMI